MARSHPRRWSRSVPGIAAAPEQTNGRCGRSGVADQSFGRTSPIRGCGLRYGRGDLDLVLNRESARGAHGNATGSQAGRAITVRRAWTVARTSDCSLAALVDALLETDQRGLSS